MSNVYRAYDLDFDITDEDLDLDFYDFGPGCDYYEACRDRRSEIYEGLPSEMIIDLGDDFNEEEEDVDDTLWDVILERTGWMVDSFKFEKVEESIALHGTLICSRPYVIGDPISLGSFTFLFENEQEATFDFCEYSYSRDAQNDSILYFKGRELDEDSFPNSKEILLKGLRESKVKAVTDVYINDDIEFDICLKELTIYIDDTAYPITKEAMRNAGFSA